MSVDGLITFFFIAEPRFVIASAWGHINAHAQHYACRRGPHDPTMHDAVIYDHLGNYHISRQ